MGQISVAFPRVTPIRARPQPLGSVRASSSSWLPPSYVLSSCNHYGELGNQQRCRSDGGVQGLEGAVPLPLYRRLAGCLHPRGRVLSLWHQSDNLSGHRRSGCHPRGVANVLHEPKVRAVWADEAGSSSYAPTLPLEPPDGLSPYP